MAKVELMVACERWAVQKSVCEETRMWPGLLKLFFRQTNKILDAFCTIAISAVMQALVIGPYFIARWEMSRNTTLSGQHFILHGMVIAVFFSLSLAFFVMALFKFRAAKRGMTAGEHKHLVLVTEVLLFVVGACITVELAHVMMRSMPYRVF